MHIRKLMLLAAVCSLIIPAVPAKAADPLEPLGLWKVLAFHTENIVTKERGRPYGERPIGFMELGADGRLSAWLATGRPNDSKDDAIGTTDSPSMYREVFYSGRYRIDGVRLIVQIDVAEHHGLVGPAPFDLTWAEGRTRPEEIRDYLVEVNAHEGHVLSMDTAPMRDPNGAPNRIIGRIIWARTSNWEFGRPD